MNADTMLLARHESAHAAAATLLGIEVLGVKRLGQHGIAVGHGYTETRAKEGVGNPYVDGIVVLIAGILHEPTHASGDVQAIERLRAQGADVDTASDQARAMVETLAFRARAGRIECALVANPTLTEEDVMQLAAG